MTATFFNEVATEYDRHRPTYPDVLIDGACKRAALETGDRVLEIGCGTGQLTGSLMQRGLQITAVEPGARLADIAAQRLHGLGNLELINARFEDADLGGEKFRAVFCASAIHWVDPDMGWQRAAQALVPGGTLTLIQYAGLDDPETADDQQAFMNSLRAIASEEAASWPRYRDLRTTLAGVHERRGNISEAWSWLGGYDLGRDYVAPLFDDAEIMAEPAQVEHTAAELSALLATMACWARLSPEQRVALQNATHALGDRLGRPIRSSTAACFVSARRQP